MKQPQSASASGLAVSAGDMDVDGSGTADQPPEDGEECTSEVAIPAATSYAAELSAAKRAREAAQQQHERLANLKEANAKADGATPGQKLGVMLLGR